MGSGFRPLKRLGQHFLQDRSVAKRIIGSMSIEDGDHILEIGPGKGILTQILIDSQAERIIGVEIDRRLICRLQKSFGDDSRFILLEEDVLKLDLTAQIEDRSKLRVVGNIPYFITSPILFHFLDHRQWLKDMTITLQKEVGERIVSPPGSKVYGIPSVLFQAFAQVETLFTIPRQAFYPIPAVDSVVLRLQFYESPVYEIEDIAFFHRLVRTVFGKRRKMLKNTLKTMIDDERSLQHISIDLSLRPEVLSITDFAQLGNELVRLNSGRSFGGETATKQ